MDSLHRNPRTVYIGCGLLAVGSVVVPATVPDFGVYFICFVWVLSIVSLVTGALRQPPNERGLWLGMSVAGALTMSGFILDGLSEAATASVTNIAADLVSWAGYATYAVCATRWVGRDLKGRQSDRWSNLDALIIGLAILILTWVTLFAPALRLDVGIYEKVSIVAFAPVSAYTFTVTTRYAFILGERRSEIGGLLAAGIGLMFVGDVVYALWQAGSIHLSDNELLIPYSWSLCCLVAIGARLSASKSLKQEFSERVPTGSLLDGGGRSNVQIGSIAIALAAPIVIVQVKDLDSIAHTRFVSSLLVVISFLAVWRVATALSEQRKSEISLRRLLYFDRVTGLLSKQGLLEGNGGLLRDHQLAVVVIDLVDFASINNNYGVEAGDEVLRRVGAVLSEGATELERIAALDSDKFVVVAFDLDEVAVAALARRFCDLAKMSIQFAGVEIYVEARAGYVWSEPGGDFFTLHCEADAALHQAKRDSVAACGYSSDIRRAALERLSLETRLRIALHRDEMEVYFQPIVGLPSREPVGLEALMRWNDGCSPAEFVPILERTGLIVEYGAWILRESCRVLAQWRAESPRYSDLYVSVNVSGVQLRDPDFGFVVERVLESFGLPPSALVLEITESVLLEDDYRLSDLLRRFEQMGIVLSLDDFGTGYSSLAYLSRYPFGVLKIDRAFVSNSNARPHDGLVPAIAAMAKSLGMKTVAEGVEHVEQLEYLALVDCDAAQGYLMCRPTPVAEVSEALSRLFDQSMSESSTLFDRSY